MRLLRCHALAVLAIGKHCCASCPPSLPHAGFKLEVLSDSVRRGVAVTNVENVALMQFPPADTMYDNLMLYRDIKVGGGGGGANWPGCNACPTFCCLTTARQPAACPANKAATHFPAVPPRCSSLAQTQTQLKPDPDAFALRVGLRGVPNTQPAVFYPKHQLYGAEKGEGHWLIVGSPSTRSIALRRWELQAVDAGQAAVGLAADARHSHCRLCYAAQAAR